jgi:hypothetical protein
VSASSRTIWRSGSSSMTKIVGNSCTDTHPSPRAPAARMYYVLLGTQFPGNCTKMNTDFWFHPKIGKLEGTIRLVRRWAAVPIPPSPIGIPTASAFPPGRTEAVSLRLEGVVGGAGAQRSGLGYCKCMARTATSSSARRCLTRLVAENGSSCRVQESGRVSRAAANMSR